MADKTLRYVVTGEDKGASKTLSGVAGAGSKAASAISSTFSRLSGVIGGEVGELASKVSEAFDGIGEAGGKSLSEKLAIGGTALAGLGAAFTLMGAGEKQATDQLNLAIQNTGKSSSDFTDEIEKSVSHMENFGYTAVQTKQALTTLTNGTHDPKKALDLLAEAADYAAVKHVSLTDASTAIVRVLGGSTRMAKEMGIQLVKNADGTTNYAATNAALAKVISGQADASADNFKGTLEHLKAVVEDNVAAFGEKYGPAITSVGVSFIALAPVVKGAASLASKIGGAFKTSAEEAQGAAVGIAEADQEITAANTEAAASSERVGAAGMKAKMGGVAAAGGIALVATAAYAGGKALSNYLEKGDAGVSVINSLGSSMSQLRTQVVNNGGDITKLGGQWAAAQVQASGLDQKAAAAGITTDQLTKAITGGSKATADLIAKWKASGNPSSQTIGALWLLTKGYASVKEQTDKAKTSTDLETTALQKTAFQGISTTQALTDLQNGFSALNGVTIDAERANIAFRDSLDNVTSSEKQNGHSLSDNTAAGRANRTAVLDSITAAQQHAQAVLKQTNSTDKARAAFDADTRSLGVHLRELGYNKNEVAAIIGEYGKMPALKETTVDVKDAATARLSYIQSQLNKATGRNWSVEVDVNENVTSRGTGIGSLSIRMEAAGTDYFPGGSTLVAEREAEVINLPRGASVTPLSKLRGMGGGGGDVYLVNVSTPQVWAGDNMTLARHVVSALETWTRNGGRIKGVTN